MQKYRKTVVVENFPTSIAITPDSSKALVTLWAGDSGVNVIDLHSFTLEFISIPNLGGNPALAITPDGKKAIAIDGGYIGRFPGTVSIMDLSSMEIIKRIRVGSGPRSIAISPDGNLA